MTLQNILDNEKARRVEGGDYGITACKETIRADIERNKKSPYELLEEYTKRAQTDIFFNKTMVLAVWEIINEID